MGSVTVCVMSASRSLGVKLQLQYNRQSLPQNGSLHTPVCAHSYTKIKYATYPQNQPKALLRYNCICSTHTFTRVTPQSQKTG